MNTKKNTPSLESIQEEYKKLCTSLGDAHYHMRQYKLQTEEILKKIDILNKIAGDLKAKKEAK